MVRMIKMDIVAIEGRTLEGVKFLGMIPEAIESEDFNVYVRWDGTKVSADRSDTDRNLVAAHVTKTVGKVEALKSLFERLANLYGVTVTVQADPGVKVSALASKVLGTYGPTQAPRVTSTEIDEAAALVTQNGRVFVEEISTFGMRRAAFDRAAERGLIEISPESDGDMRVFTLPPVAPAHTCSTAGCKTGQAPVMLLKIATGPSAKYTNDTYFCAPCWAWYRHSTELGNVLECIELVEGAYAAESAPAEYESLDIPTNAEVDALMAEHDAAMAAWAAPLVEALTVRTSQPLPIRTPGASLANLGEAWHGTNTCVNCGCDPQMPVYSVNRSFRFPMAKRARKQVKRAKRTRVGA